MRKQQPYRRWKSEEIAALYAGVQKHGPGKWKEIINDHEFRHCFPNRSNVDLKDKWRNLTCNALSHSSNMAPNIASKGVVRPRNPREEYRILNRALTRASRWLRRIIEIISRIAILALGIHAYLKWWTRFNEHVKLYWVV